VHIYIYAHTTISSIPYFHDINASPRFDVNKWKKCEKNMDVLRDLCIEDIPIDDAGSKHDKK